MTPPRLRPELGDLTPYHSTDPATARVRLHANENPYPPPRNVAAEMNAAVAALELNRYPDPDPVDLRTEIADYAGVEIENVLVGDGANEILLQACLAFGGPGRKALLFEPTYRMHYRQARMAGTLVEVVERGSGFDIDIAAAEAHITSTKPDIVVVCSPNNPTGTLTPIDDIVRLAKATQGLMIVDEAYYEFSGETVVPQLSHLPNVLVARTLSKALGLAGVRIGYGLASPDVLDGLARVKMPYAQSAPALALALVAIRRRADLLPRVEDLITGRKMLMDALTSLPTVMPFPSGANFILFTVAAAAEVHAALHADGIVIRNFTALIPDALRVSVGTPEENEAFVAAITRLTS